MHKTELIRRRNWRGLDDVELATPQYVDLFDHRHVHSACADIPTVDYEHNCYRQKVRLNEDRPATASLH